VTVPPHAMNGASMTSSTIFKSAKNQSTWTWTTIVRLTQVIRVRQCGTQYTLRIVTVRMVWTHWGKSPSKPAVKLLYFTRWCQVCTVQSTRTFRQASRTPSPESSSPTQLTFTEEWANTRIELRTCTWSTLQYWNQCLSWNQLTRSRSMQPQTRMKMQKWNRSPHKYSNRSGTTVTSLSTSACYSKRHQTQRHSWFWKICSIVSTTFRGSWTVFRAINAV